MTDYTFDVIFIDCGPSEPYHSKTPENNAMGGTESSCIKVAEGLGKLGLTVGIIKAEDPKSGVPQYDFEPIMGQYAFFLPQSFLTKITTKISIMLRGPLYINYFPKAQKFIWLHDAVDERIVNWLPSLEEHKATIVCVSKWHMDQAKQYLKYDKITYCYNPIPDEIFVDASKPRERVNRDLMVWASSPHKDLNGALATFSKLKTKIPNVKLLVYNPGYVKGEIIINPGVLYYGPTASRHVLHNIRNALCVFYPSSFEETFGLVMAEANAVGCPVAAYNKGALPEIVSHPLADTEEELIDGVEDMYNNSNKLPIVKGNPEFKTTAVIKQWVYRFAGQLN